VRNIALFVVKCWQLNRIIKCAPPLEMRALWWGTERRKTWIISARLLAGSKLIKLNRNFFLRLLSLAMQNAGSIYFPLFRWTKMFIGAHFFLAKEKNINYWWLMQYLNYAIRAPLISPWLHKKNSLSIFDTLTLSQFNLL